MALLFRLPRHLSKARQVHQSGQQRKKRPSQIIRTQQQHQQQPQKQHQPTGLYENNLQSFFISEFTFYVFFYLCEFLVIYSLQQCFVESILPNFVFNSFSDSRC